MPRRLLSLALGALALVVSVDMTPEAYEFLTSSGEKSANVTDVYYT